MLRTLRLGVWLGAAGTVIASGAQAQTTGRAQLPAGAVVQSLIPDNGAELRRHLTTLADNPRSLDALIGAGRAALAGGDTQAALTFFSRAGEVAPSDPRVRAGMASVLVRMERGQPALNLFAEAVALGAPLAEIAGDRGLAHDMVGDPRRAQQDYALVLQRREDPEIRRRLALSLAISGEREAALRVIDGQLRRNERAAWRTQAFVLALTGDPAGANRTAQGLMPAAAAQAMAPFFSRLSTLNASQKAMAAHFGRFPSNGGRGIAGANETRADPGALALATGGPAPRPRIQTADPAPAATRRRPGSNPTDRQSGEAQTSGRARPPREIRSLREIGENPGPRTQRRVAQETGRQTPAPPTSTNVSRPPVSSPAAGSVVQSSAPARTTDGPPLQSAPTIDSADLRPSSGQPNAASSVPLNRPVTSIVTPVFPPTPPSVTFDPPRQQVESPALQLSGPSIPAARTPGTLSVAGGSSTRPVSGFPSSAEPSAADTGSTQLRRDDSIAAAIRPTPSPAPEAPAETMVVPESTPGPSAAGRAGGLSDIAALVATLPEDEARAARQASSTRPSESRAVQTPRGSSPPAARPATTRARPTHPARHWVQIAGGANAAALPRELARLRGLASELVGREAWITPANATNRLLVGPFASTAEAQELVNKLSRRNLTAFAWTSAAGQEIARLQPGR